MGGVVTRTEGDALGLSAAEAEGLTDEPDELDDPGEPVTEGEADGDSVGAGVTEAAGAARLFGSGLGPVTTGLCCGF